MAGRTVQVPTVNDNTVHGEWMAGDREVLRVTTGAFNGRQTVRLSLWWKPRGATENDPYLPSKRGITFPLECGGVIGEIADALEDAVASVTAPQPSANGKADAKLSAENDALKSQVANLETLMASIAARLPADPEPAPQPRKRGRPRKTAAA